MFFLSYLFDVKVPFLTLNENELLKKIKHGDVSAYEKVFHDHYSSLCLFGKKIVGDLDTARDIVQEIFVTLYANRNAIEINTSLKSYLFKSVYHACLNSIKRHKSHLIHHDYLKLILPFSDDYDTIINTELEEKIHSVIDTLPDQCRKIFKMNRFDGKKNREIAEELGISIRTVETQISKALSILRTNLSDFLPLLFILITG